MYHKYKQMEMLRAVLTYPTPILVDAYTPRKRNKFHRRYLYIGMYTYMRKGIYRFRVKYHLQ